MRAIKKVFLLTALGLLCVLAKPVPCSGQSVWLPLNEEPTLSLDILKADLSHPPDEGPKFSSTVWFLSARIPASD